jgi:hypothetical protein
VGDGLVFTAPLWRWQGQGAWHFVTLPPEAAEQVEDARERVGGAGFGSVPVEVRVGGSTWRTSVFPDKRSGSFLLPMKAAVRRAEGLEEGDEVAVHLVTHP